jgi:hypothetical protein
MTESEYANVKLIIVANVLECYYKSYDELDPGAKEHWYKYDNLESNRSYLYDSDNKVVVTSVPINTAHFNDIKTLMNWKNVFNLFPTNPTPSISTDIKNQQDLRSRITEIIKTNPGVSIIPYRSTPEFHEMVQSLKDEDLKFMLPETLEKKNSFIHEYANSKRGFRHLWEKSVPLDLKKKIYIPEGFICADKKEAIVAARWFFDNNKSIVIKYNNGTQGIGVLLLKREDLPSERKSFDKKLNEILSEGIWNEPMIIVEEFINVDKNSLGGSPNVEFYITPEGKVVTSYYCEQVLLEDRKTFSGIYVHPKLLKNKYLKLTDKAGIFFGAELKKLGYRGIYDIDVVISEEGKVYAVESNLRRTGGTHIHHASVSLLGKDYGKKYHVFSEDLHLKGTMDYIALRAKLAHVLFDKRKKEGIVFANPDMLEEKVLNTIIIAKKSETIFRIREEIKKVVDVK